MKFKKIKLPNGLRIILVPRPQSLAATALILVEAGSEYETKNINGLSHFLEHMMFKGTVNRPNVGQVAEELASLGAQSNAFTSYEYTGYWAKVESRKLSKILDIVSDLYLNPVFNPQEIEKERGVVIEEINMYEDTPARRVNDLFISLLYGDQPAGWDVAGRKENIRRVKKEDFLKYRNRHYVAKKTTVVVAGSFNQEKILKQIKNTFGTLKKGERGGRFKTKESQSSPGVSLLYKKSDQSHIVLGVRAFDMFDKRRYTLQVLSDVLGGGMSSRLFKKIREELGAAYYVRSAPDLYLDHGYLGISVGINHEKFELVVSAILGELRLLTKEKVSPSELQKTKDHIIGNIILGLETTDEIGGFYGEQEILAGKILTPDQIIDKIKSVKAEEIMAVAKDIFRNNKLNLSVVGPYKNEKIFKKILKL